MSDAAFDATLSPETIAKRKRYRECCARSSAIECNGLVSIGLAHGYKGLYYDDKSTWDKHPDSFKGESEIDEYLAWNEEYLTAAVEYDVAQARARAGIN